MRGILRFALATCVLAAFGGTGIAFPTPPALRLTQLSGNTAVLSDPSSGATLTIGSYAAITYGTAKELVYYSDSSLTDYLVSELDWPLQPSFSWGTNLALRFPVGAVISVDFRSAVPGGTGYMQDSDYLNFDSAHTRTHFSQQDGYLERSLGIRADLGWGFPVVGDFSLTPFLRYAYLNIEWSAQNGYYQYPPASETSPPYTPWSSSESKTNLYGMVATYQQTYSIPAVGIGGTYRLNPLLSIGAKVAFSPLASINDVDNHLLRNLVFYDSMSAATYVESGIKISFQPSEVFGLTLNLSYLDVTSPPNGSIVTEDTTNGSKTSAAGTGSTAGASIQTFGATIGVHLGI